MRTSIIAALIFFSLAPTALVVAATPAALGGYCANNAGCQSGNCDTSSWFSFNYKCVPAGSGSTPQPSGSICYAPSDCVSGNCVFSDLEGVAKCQPKVATPTTQGPGNGNPIQGPGNTGTSVTLINPLKSGTSLTSFLNNILDFVINVGSIIVILMLVFVGFKFVVAQGKDAALVEARKMLLWTIIGALVLLGAKAISAGILATVQSLGG